MRFTSINTNLDITDEEIIEAINKKGKISFLDICTYIEEEEISRHITFNICNDIDKGGFDIWIDLDIYQAELFAKNILLLVENRKKFLENKLKNEL